MYILYGGPHTRAILVEMVLAEGGISYELRAVDTVRQEHRSAEFLALNPAGLVPVLITPEGEILTETPAINLYLAEHHGLTQIAPRADEPERGRFLSGLFYLTDELEPAIKRYFYPHRYAPRPEDTQTIKSQALEAALERFGVIDRGLRERGPYHLGSRFSLVDLTLAHWVASLQHQDILEANPAVRHCRDLVMARPKLRAKFDVLQAHSVTYARMQARGAGVE